MTVYHETLFNNRDNYLRIVLYRGARVFSEVYPSVTPTRWTLVAGTLSLDSAGVGQGSVFAWDAASSTLQVTLDGLSATVADYTPVTLTVYSAEWDHGLVWLHPTGTEDKLYIRIV